MEVSEMLKNFVVVTSICVILGGLSANAQVVSGPPVAKNNSLPDLVVKEIKYETSPDTIRVRVLNQGTGVSSSCYLALLSMVGENAALGTKRVWTIEIPALQPGKGFSNTIVVSPLTQSNGPWKAVVDRSNKVKESNESNNQLTYQLSIGGSVVAPMPDLQITRAVLIDATNGEVSVEVTNSESVSAPASQLRLIVWEMGKFEKGIAKEVFVKVPGVAGHEKINVKIKAGVPIISTKYSLYVDIGNDVPETKENNNRYEGEAGKS
jgi:subtilase family serine protease